MAALAGYNADISIAGGAGTGTPFTNEATTAVVALTIYQITNTAKRLLDPTVAVTVQKSTNGTDWTTITTGFHIAYAGGVIRFPAAQASNTTIRVSGSYLAASALGQSKEWSISGARDTTDSTIFTAQANGGSATKWKKCIASLGDVSISVSRWFLDAYFLPTISDPATFYHLKLYTDYANTKHIDALVRLSGDSIKNAINATVEQSLTFKATGLINTLQMV